MSTQSTGSGDSLLRFVLIALALLLLVPFVLMALMVPTMGAWWMSDHAMGTGWDGRFWLAWLFPLVVVVGGAVLLFWALRGRNVGEGDAALEELRLAYARGELDDEEFERRRRRLRGDADEGSVSDGE